MENATIYPFRQKYQHTITKNIKQIIVINRNRLGFKFCPFS